MNYKYLNLILERSNVFILFIKDYICNKLVLFVIKLPNLLLLNLKVFVSNSYFEKEIKLKQIQFF